MNNNKFSFKDSSMFPFYSETGELKLTDIASGNVFKKFIHVIAKQIIGNVKKKMSTI